MSKRLPQGDHPLFAGGDTAVIRQACNPSKARVLKFRLTKDVTRHLYLDRKSHTVEIFHCTSFLKEHLILSRNDLSAGAKSHILPRQLAPEIIDSIQKVVFSFLDAGSMKILKHLVSQGGFDPDCLRFESEAIRTLDEQHVPFHYFGKRLGVLLDHVENPRARGMLEKWLERKSGARYVMLATSAGVIFALLLGIVALAVSGYQTWITYQAWQQPISPS